jgi:hypothetical protein
MTAPSIPSDSEAREIAQRLGAAGVGRPNCTNDEILALGADGSIGATLYGAAKHGPPPERIHDWVSRGLRDLLAYVCHHGKRGPQTDWPSLGNGGASC